MGSWIWWLPNTRKIFGAVKLVKNSDIDKFKYCGYGIGFDRRRTFSVANGYGKNGIIFGFEMSSFVHVDTKIKDILIFGEGLDDTTLTANTHTHIYIYLL